MHGSCRTVWMVAAVGVATVMAAATPDAAADGALRAAGRVRSAEPGPAVSIALGTGYGFTEGVLDASDAHHRIGGAAGIAVRVARWLELGGELRGRYDKHTGDMPDDGFVGDPRLWLTGTRALGGAGASQRWLALRLGVWLPGHDVPSVDPDAVSLDVAALVTVKRAATLFTASAGFRLDRSSNSIDASLLSAADRLGLGLSESDAVLIGASVVRRSGDWELLGEASWDLLVGSAAPSPIESPLRIGVGARRRLDDSVTLEGLVELAASSRPELDGTLVAVEPRVAATLGLSWRPRPKPVAVPVIVEVPVKEPEPPPPPPVPTTGAVRGRVVDSDGAPLPGATVRLGARTVVTGDDGDFTLAEIAPGSVDVLVERVGHDPTRRTLTITAGVEAQLDVALSRVKPPSQIRGVIRSFDGKGLSAKVRVEPSGVEVTAGDDGSFQVDVPPGSYTVVVTMDGFDTQRRPAKVEDEGVAVLNIELRKAKR